jgi:hypothetical protein
VGYLDLTTEITPSAPSAANVVVFADSAEDDYLKTINSKGVIGAVGDHELCNYIRNSGLRFAQKQTPASATTYSNTTGRTQIADGWGVTNENASITYARVDTNTAPETNLRSRYYGTALKITATGKIIITQAIFGNDTCDLRGRTVRVQAKVKVPSGTPLINMALVQLNSSGTIDTPPATFISAFGANAVDPTLGTNLAYIAPKSGVTNDNCTTDGNHVELTSSTNWQRFGAVFDVPSNCKNLFVMFYGDSQFAAAAGFSLAEVSLTIGYEIQNWAPMTDAEELDRLVEYYKTFNLDTGPAQNVGLNTGEFKFQGTVVGAIAFAGVGFRFPKRLRAAPTTNTLYNPSAANAQIRDVTDSVDMTGSTVTANGECGVWLNGTGAAGNAAGEHLAVHLSCEAFM